MNQEVAKYIRKSEASQQGILSELRQLIMSVAPEATEQFKWGRPVYALEKDFCYLKTTKKHVTLGFFDFNKIQTNQNLIEGTGNSMRHVKLSSPDDIEGLQVSKMLEEVLA